MARFDFSGFAPAEPEPGAGAMPAPAFEPTDATHVNGALNDFLAAKQDALFHAPDAFYRTMGRDAVQAAPAADDRLEQLRADTLAGVANDNQRRHLGEMLDAQMHLAREDMARHVVTQTEAWQRQTAQDRIEALTKEAALHHGDAGLIDSLASAAEAAARAHAAPDEADNAAAHAYSGVLASAIQAQLDRGNTSDAAAQLERLKEQLSDAHAGPLQAQLDTVQRFDAARAYADGIVPYVPAATAEAIEAQRAAAAQQVAADHSDDEAQRALAQHFVDVGFDGHRTQLDRATAERDQAVQHWLTTPDADGQPQTSPPPAALWNTLDPEQRVQVLMQLRLNGRPDGTDAPASTVMSDADPEPMTHGQQYAQAMPSTAPSPKPAVTSAKPSISENELDTAQTLAKADQGSRAASARRELDALVSTPRNSEDEKKKGPVPVDWEKRLPAATVKKIDESAATYGVPRDLIVAILWEESTFNEKASAGPNADGKGLASMSLGAQQDLIDKARQEINPERERELKAFDRMNGPDAVSMAAEYLKMLYDKNGQHWPTAVLAYTMGSGNTAKWLNGVNEDVKKKNPARWKEAETYLRRIFDGRSHRFDRPEDVPEYP